MSKIAPPGNTPPMPDNGEMPDNQGMATEGLMNVYPPPPGRSPGTIDGHWGDAPPPRPLGHDGNYGKGAFDAAMDARHGVLKRIFDGIPEAKENARKTIRELFEHGGDHEHESHTAVMAEEKTSSARHLPEDESLTDRVLAVCGRR